MWICVGELCGSILLGDWNWWTTVHVWAICMSLRTALPQYRWCWSWLSSYRVWAAKYVAKSYCYAPGTWVSFSAICRTVHRFGFTKKKLTTVAAQQSDAQRGTFIAEISIFNPNMIIWVDKRGSDRRNAIRSNGYSLRGMLAVNCVLRVGEKRLSVIGAMSVDGIEEIYIAEGNVNGTSCEQLCFLSSSLLMAQTVIL